MIDLLLASAIAVKPYGQMQESIDRMCANRLNIPYGSDNVTDREWAQFQLCREIMNDSLYHVPVEKPSTISPSWP